MKRREFAKAVGTLATGVGLAGCATEMSGNPSARETIVRDVPTTENDTDEPPMNVEETDSDHIKITDIVYQAPPDRGILVSGNVQNVSERTFKNFYVEVTLYDVHKTGENVLETHSAVKEHDNFAAGQTWRWAVSFRDDPITAPNAYSVTAAGEFE